MVGLGTGTIAAYGEDQDYFRFYEINPEVVRFATQYFTYLKDCPSQIEIIEGLQPGERIVVAGVSFLRDGMKVRDLGDALGAPL